MFSQLTDDSKTEETLQDSKGEFGYNKHNERKDNTVIKHRKK